jgi:hypothetical protein
VAWRQAGEDVGVSITYQLGLRTPVGADAVMAAMVEVGAGAVEAHEGTKGSLRGGGWVDVDVAEFDPPDPVERRFGFAPTIAAYFGLAKFGDLVAQEADVLRLALGVLARVPGDALLHLHHDEVWLLRRGGTLTINESLWRPHLALLPDGPYERAPLAFD